MIHNLGQGWIAASPWSHSPLALISCWAGHKQHLCPLSKLSCALLETLSWPSLLGGGFRGRIPPQRVHSSLSPLSSEFPALCQFSRLCSVGAAALSKPRRDMSDFRQEEQLVIKNNNLEVFELYFSWLPHAQNLNPSDKSCTFGFNMLMLSYSRAGWSPQPGFVGGTKSFPDTWPSTAHSSLPGTVIYNSQRKLCMTLLPANCFKVNFN